MRRAGRTRPTEDQERSASIVGEVTSESLTTAYTNAREITVAGGTEETIYLTVDYEPPDESDGVVTYRFAAWIE